MSRPHWSFGAGPHRCPAAYFVPRMLEICLAAWLRRILEFEVLGAHDGVARWVAFDPKSFDVALHWPAAAADASSIAFR